MNLTQTKRGGTRIRRGLLVGGIVTTLVAGCSAGGGKSGDEPSPTRAPGIRLSAPPVADSRQVTVVVDAAGIPKGAQGSLYAYGGTWDPAVPSCSGNDPIATFDIVEGPSPVVVSLPRSGIYTWVLAAPGYSTKCDAKSQTVLRDKLRISLGQKGGGGTTGLNALKAPLVVGKPFVFSVLISGNPSPRFPLAAKISWYGPFPDAPSAVAAGCGEGVPIGLTETVKIDSKDADNEYDVTVTPKSPGVYRVLAAVEETADSVATDSGCDDNAPFLLVKS